jgi:hypothetical protein
VIGWVTEAQIAFATFEHREWLEWGGKILMSTFAARAAEEDAVRAIEEAVAKEKAAADAEAAKRAEELAEAKAKAEAAAAKVAEEAARAQAEMDAEIAALTQAFCDEKLDADTYDRRIAEIEARGKAVEELSDDEDIVHVTGSASARTLGPVSDGEDEIADFATPPPPAKMAKRKAEGTVLREVEGKVNFRRMCANIVLNFVFSATAAKRTRKPSWTASSLRLGA